MKKRRFDIPWIPGHRAFGPARNDSIKSAGTQNRKKTAQVTLTVVTLRQGTATFLFRSNRIRIQFFSWTAWSSDIRIKGMVCGERKFRAGLVICLSVLALALLSAPSRAQDFWAREAGVSPQAVEDAISRCMVYLNSRPDQAGGELSACYRYSDGGAEALLALAELEAGVKPESGELAKLIEKVLKQNSNRVFARSVRTVLLSKLYERTSDKKMLEKIQAEVDWLVRHQLASGGWGDPAGPGNTNDTAEALRALQAAAGVGATVQLGVWQKVGGFLKKVQNPDGGFGFYPRGAQPVRLRGASNGSATAAGASALAVLMNVKKDQYSTGDERNRQRALAWLDRHYQLDQVPAWYWGDSPLYGYLFDLACATGKPMRLGGRDVDVEIANLLQARQRRSGAWLGEALAEDDIVSSAWAILTLRKIRPAAETLPRLAEKSPPPVVFVPGRSRKPDSARPVKFLVIGRVAVPEGSIDFAKIADGLSDALNKAINIGVQYQDVYPDDIQADSVPRDVSLLWLTGERPGDFAAVSAAKIKNFLKSGGVLLVDSATGAQREFDSARKALTEAFGLGSLEPIPTGDPLVQGNFGVGLGCDLTSVKYNPAAIRFLSQGQGNTQGPPMLWAIRKRGKIMVVLSRLALAGPAEGKNSARIPGYVPIDARRIALNVLLYANSTNWRLVTGK